MGWLICLKIEIPHCDAKIFLWPLRDPPKLFIFKKIKKSDCSHRCQIEEIESSTHQWVLRRFPNQHWSIYGTQYHIFKFFVQALLFFFFKTVIFLFMFRSESELPGTLHLEPHQNHSIFCVIPQFHTSAIRLIVQMMGLTQGLTLDQGQFPPPFIWDLESGGSLPLLSEE